MSRPQWLDSRNSPSDDPGTVQFDPIVYETGRQSGRLDIQVSNLVGFFVETITGNDVVGRLVPMTGLVHSGTLVPTNSFLRAIRLVE